MSMERLEDRKHLNGAQKPTQKPAAETTPAAGKIIYPSTKTNGIIHIPDENREGVNFDKLAFAFGLPFSPSHTDTLAHLEKFEDLNVDKIRRVVGGLILDVDGTLVPHHGYDFSPEVVEKLREIRAKMRVCVFSNNGQEREIFIALGIPVVKHAAPKPAPEGFHRAAYHYLDLKPERCAMVGDNILTDGGARKAGMELILVDPIPGPEGFFHKLTRGYGRAVKQMHDRLFRRRTSRSRLP
jgi:HAD superfamily phosphatase (TIGR01668 family)